MWTSNSNVPTWQIEGGMPRLLRLDPDAAARENVAGGEQTAAMVATGAIPELIAPFGLDRFERGDLTAEKGAAAVGH